MVASLAQMAFIPEADTGIVILANADVLGNMLGRNVQYRLVEMLFGLEPLIDQVTAAELEGIGGPKRGLQPTCSGRSGNGRTIPG